MGAINVSDIEIDPTIELTDKMHPTLGLGATFMVRCNFLQIYVNTYLLDNKGHLKYCTNRLHAIYQIFRYQVAQLSTLRHWPKRPKNTENGQFWPKLKYRRADKFRAWH